MHKSDTVGAQIARMRKTRGLTQVQLAQAAKVSKSMLAQVETGHSSASVVWIGTVAKALGVDTSALYGREDDLNNLHELVPTIRRVLTPVDLLDPAIVPEPLDQLRPLVLKVGKWRHAAAYSQIAKHLPELVDHLLVAGQEHGEPAYAMLTQAYRAANTLAHKLGYNDLSMTATDRMVWAAARSGDPLLLATTHYVQSAALARIGARRQAVLVTERAIADVTPLAATDETAAAVLSALHMRRGGLDAIYSGSSTQDHLDEASRLAEQVGDRQVYGTIVGPANVQLWRMAAAVDLGNPGAAIQIAENTSVPSDYPKERHAHYWLDLARAYLGAGDPDKAIDALEESRAAAPEYFRSSRSVKTAIKTAAGQQRKATHGLRALANYAGIED